MSSTAATTQPKVRLRPFRDNNASCCDESQLTALRFGPWKSHFKTRNGFFDPFSDSTLLFNLRRPLRAARRPPFKSPCDEEGVSRRHDPGHPRPARALACGVPTTLIRRNFDSQLDEPRLRLIEPAPVFKEQSKLGMNRRDFSAGVFAAVAIPLSRLSAQTVPAPLKPGTSNGVPAAPSGPVVLIVSISEQIAYVYRNGIRIGVSTCSTGAPGHRTPTGVFTILQKNADHYSNLYNNAPMPYMQRLTWRHRPPRWRFSGFTISSGVPCCTPGIPLSNHRW